MSALGGGGGGGYSSSRVKRATVREEETSPEPVPPVISEEQLFSDWQLPLDATFQLAGRYTQEQFHALQERVRPLGRQIRRLELLDGEVFVSSSAREPHAVAISNLMVSLTLSVRRQKLGMVYTEFALLMDKFTEVMPDLIFATEADLSRCGEKGIRGAAELVAEVVESGDVSSEGASDGDVGVVVGGDPLWVSTAEQEGAAHAADERIGLPGDQGHAHPQ